MLKISLVWVGSVFVALSPLSTMALPKGTQDSIAGELSTGRYQAAKDRALSLSTRAGLVGTDAAALINIANLYADYGLRDQAAALLMRAAELIDAPSSDTDRRALLDIGNALQALNLRSNASTVVNRGIKIMGKDTSDALNAQGFVALGDMAFETGDESGALIAYVNAESAMDSPSDDGMIDLKVKQIKLLSRSNDESGLADAIAAYQQLTTSSEVDSELARRNLNVASSLITTEQAGWLPVVTALVEQAAQVYQSDGDAALRAEVEHLRGLITSLSGDSEAALLRLRGALADLGSDAAPGQSYRIYWQMAKLQTDRGDLDAAIKNYERAIGKLEMIRSELLQGSTLVFKERVLPVYQGYIELLLQKAAGSEQGMLWLSKVQSTLEALNASEVLDYFDDNCVLPREVMNLATNQPGTAIVYPIILDKKAAILVRTDMGIYQYDLPVSSEVLRQQIIEFRATITNPQTSETQVAAQARALYEALLAPGAAVIEQPSVQTLVTVPSGYLRLLPLAALHNGDDFLVNRYELATTLGLQLTENSVVSQGAQSAFIGGVSDSVQGFTALPGVESELEGLEAALSAEPLLNQGFSVANVSRRLGSGREGIVHLATHGYFDGDHANSFLLAHDDKITLDRLQSTLGARRFSSSPVDLLVLSACETAKGDERAALGLAGVSLKAGARSTVASLWPIADEATAKLMQRFYESLQSGESKAKALQTAQQMLLSDPEWAHPNYWSPYLLIGNWQ
ncbi:MAG: CHAT domain-containing protein [Pseudomonadales bacterium]